jgi:tRNA(Ile)-lysidine synthase
MNKGNLEKFTDDLKCRFNWPENGTIIIATSGGPDSVFLLIVMNELSKTAGFNIHVVHVDHMLRGEDSLGDSLFVSKLSAKLKIPCTIKRIDIPNIMKTEKGSSQEVCRKYRLEFLFDEVKRINAVGLAFGHNKNDQAETLLINLLRGSGMNGLSGMKTHEAKNGVGIYRPILHIEKEDIEKFLNDEKIDYRLDKSNLEDDYVRNHIRHNLVPVIEKEYNPNIIQALYNTARIIDKDNDFINAYVKKVFDAFFSDEKTALRAKAESIISEDIAIQLRLVRLAYEKLIGNVEMLTFNHSIEMIDVVKSAHGFSINLPKNIVAEKIYDDFYLYKKGHFDSDPLTEVTVQLGKQVEFSQTIMTFYETKDVNIDKSEYAFDKEELSLPLHIRTRIKGDRFTPFNFSGTKKIKDFMIDEKIPHHIRDSVPLLVDDNGKILAVIGLRRSNHALINERSSEIIKCKILEVPNWKKI